MERKVPFEINEFYHLYTRGVEKRDIFTTETDSERFLTLLFTCNDTKSVKISNLSPAQRGFPSLVRRARETLVDIGAYALMPNHVHLIVREKTVGGISKFMLKLMTGYSMYFNTKYERSGPLFTRPFRSQHIDTDRYLRWVFAYTLLNPLELFQTQWEQNGIVDKKAASRFIEGYKYSSYPDYFGGKRLESAILDHTSLPILHEMQNFDDLLSTLSESTRDDATISAFAAKSLV